MADLLSKSHLFSSCSYNHHPNQINNVSVCSRICYAKNFRSLTLKSHGLRSGFHGDRVAVGDRKTIPNREGFHVSIKAQTTLRIGKAQKWWEKGLQSNMKEISSANELVESLLNSGDKLVVVEFFSPGCGGCRALHPKICQLAEMNLEVQFVQINYEDHKSMCYSLGVHVLPFFRFYRGAHGRLCSFSCTNATIKKFKDALAKHTTDRCSIGPTKGLEEKELIALAANRELNFNYTPKPTRPDPVPSTQPDLVRLPLTTLTRTQDSEEKKLVASS